jgi:hypothetical protein
LVIGYDKGLERGEKGWRWGEDIVVVVVVVIERFFENPKRRL